MIKKFGIYKIHLQPIGVNQHNTHPVCLLKANYNTVDEAENDLDKIIEAEHQMARGMYEIRPYYKSSKI